jgi:hypothetical protein
MAYRNPALSKSHNPFARSAKLGPGPNKGTLHERHDWKCRKKKGTKYVQICKYIGEDPALKGTKKTIRAQPEDKAVANKKYNRWLKASGEPRFANRPRRRR